MKEHNVFHELCVTHLDEVERRGAALMEKCNNTTQAFSYLSQMADQTTLYRVLDNMRAERKRRSCGNDTSNNTSYGWQ